MPDCPKLQWREMRQLSLMVAVLLLSLPPMSMPLAEAGPAPSPEVVHPILYRPASLSIPGSPPFAPSDIRKAYNFLPLYSRGLKGNGTRIAIIDAFGDPTLTSDLSSFNSQTGLPPATVNMFFPDGANRRSNAGWALETALDVEWAHAIAPSATIDLVVAFDASLGSIFDGIAFVANSLPNERVLSMSFGLPELSYPTTGSFTIAATHQLFVTITSHGTTPFASSGDSGATVCCNPQYPASDPLVVAVGGTSLALNSDASYGSETAWSGSGAGSSTVFSKPSWQQGLGDSMRDIVDVSYDADLNTGVLVIQGGVASQVGGTSVGAPQWAALVDLASQANSQTFGAINAKLYKTSSYHDITVGSDTFFTAGVGWDYPTGLGTPDANATVRALSPTITVPISNSAVFDGSSVVTMGSLVANLGNGTFSGSVTVTARNSTTHIVIFNKTYTIPLTRFNTPSSSVQTSIFLVNIIVKPYNLSSAVFIQLKNNLATVSIGVTRQVDIHHVGVVDIADASALAVAFGSTTTDPNYNPLADFDANGDVSIVDASILALDFDSPSYF